MRAPIELGFAANALDRAGAERDPEAHLRHVGDPAAFEVALAGEFALLGAGLDRPEAMLPGNLIAPEAAIERVFLGRLDGAPVTGVALDPARLDAYRADERFVVGDLRTLAVEARLPAGELGMLAQAKSLLLWHARHRFCSQCGAATAAALAGLRRDCPSCAAQHFPRTDPVSIMLVTDGERCLLGRQARFPAGSYSCLAGFVSPGETIEDAVRREILEEAGIRVGRVRYLLSQPWPFPSSLMIGCLAEALTAEITLDRDELEDGRWFSREEAAAMLDRRHPDGLVTPPPMAIAHHILRAWIEGEGFA